MDFRCGTDEYDRPTPYVWRKSILMHAIKPTKLFHKQQRASAGFPAIAGTVKDLSQIRHTRENG